MKKWLILLALLLLLTGCEETPPTEPTLTQPTTTPVQQPLSQWDLPGDGMMLLGVLGDGFVLYDGSQLFLISMDDKQVQAAAVVENLRYAQPEDLQVGENGISFYDRQTQRVHFLNENLEKTTYLQLQGQVQGSVFLTEDWSRLYHCSQEGVHVVDMNTGVSRVIAHRRDQWLGVTGLFMDTMLSCAVTQKDGTVGTVIVAADTGETAWESGRVGQLHSVGELYFGKLTSAGKDEWVFGWGADQPRNFWPPVDGPILPLLENAAVVTVETDRLTCYDLEAGTQMATLEFLGASDVDKILYRDGKVYFTDGKKLYGWDLELTAVEEEEIYTSFRYTEDDPDEAGLQEQVLAAKVLEKLYNVRILLWNDVKKIAPQGYEFTVEYFPEAYPQALDALGNGLRNFEWDFLTKLGSWKEENLLNIVLVRQILADGESVPGIQYVLNGKVYIALAIGENMEENLYHLIGHGADTVVLLNSLAYDDWELLNPKDFSYANSYTEKVNGEYEKYLQAENRWFIDENAMRFQVEDRATIFTSAIMPGNEALFAGEAMQAKLKMLCKGIREAFDLTDKDYAWEQYLKEETK